MPSLVRPRACAARAAVITRSHKRTGVATGIASLLAAGSAAAVELQDLARFESSYAGSSAAGESAQQFASEVQDAASQALSSNALPLDGDLSPLLAGLAVGIAVVVGGGALVASAVGGGSKVKVRLGLSNARPGEA